MGLFQHEILLLVTSSLRWRPASTRTLPCLGQRGADGFHFGVVLIMAARPEESLEAVTLPPRHHVNVNVRHALAYTVVDRDERSLRAECLFHQRAETAGLREQLRGKRIGEVGEELIMNPRNHQAVARKQRPMIEESEAIRRFENFRRRKRAGRNTAKCAVRRSAHADSS